MAFIGFPNGFALFWVGPFGFSFFFVSVLVLKEKPKENYWKPNPSRLRGPSGASFWVSPSSVISLSHVTERGEYRLGCSGPPLGPSFLFFSYSACSGAPSPGLPLSLSLSSGLLWTPLATRYYNVVWAGHLRLVSVSE